MRDLTMMQQRQKLKIQILKNIGIMMFLVFKIQDREGKAWLNSTKYAESHIM